MNREIKFRAFDDGKMIYENNILHLSVEDNQILRLAKFWCNIRPDSIIMQWTELKDKNGKEIYESDIIKTETDKLMVITWSKRFASLNYKPGSIGFAEGFMGPKGDVGFFMVADWNKAKAIIEKLLSEGRNIEEVEMGLDGDWCENSMTVWQDGEFTEYDCYDISQWAEPIIIVNYKDAPSETYSAWSKEAK